MWLWRCWRPLGAVLALLPFVVIKIRLLLYRYFLPVKNINIPVISVGNMTFGGTGKTPLIAWIADYYQQQGKKICILTRGYKRKNHLPFLVVDARSNLTVKDIGDEAYLLFRNGYYPLVVTKHKQSGAEIIEKKIHPDVILMDDGFQYLKLAKDMNICVINSLESPDRLKLFPAGLLREPLSGLKRADLLFLSHSTEHSLEWIKKIIRSNNSQSPIFRTAHEPIGLEQVFTRATLPLTVLKGKKVGAFCGIGFPEGFRSTIQSLGAQLIYFKTLPDHTDYSPKTLGFLKSWSSNTDFLITTEKDAYKIADLDRIDLSLYFLKIKLKIMDHENELKSRLDKLLYSNGPHSGN